MNSAVDFCVYILGWESVGVLKSIIRTSQSLDLLGVVLINCLFVHGNDDITSCSLASFITKYQIKWV